MWLGLNGRVRKPVWLEQNGQFGGGGVEIENESKEVNQVVKGPELAFIRNSVWRTEPQLQDFLPNPGTKKEQDIYDGSNEK